APHWRCDVRRVNRENEGAFSSHARRDQLDGFPHVARVMKRSPRIHDVEAAKLGERVTIERRGDPELDPGVWTESPAVLFRDRDARLADVDAHDWSGSQCGRCNREEPTAATHIEKTASAQRVAGQQPL